MLLEWVYLQGDKMEKNINIKENFRKFLNNKEETEPLLTFYRIESAIILSKELQEEMKNENSEIKKQVTEKLTEVKYQLLKDMKFNWYSYPNTLYIELNPFCERFNIKLPSENEIKERIKKEDEEQTHKIKNMLSFFKNKIS